MSVKTEDKIFEIMGFVGFLGTIVLTFYLVFLVWVEGG